MIFHRRPIGGPLILFLVKRLALFSLILCVFCLFLYGLGTRQEFTDRTQLLLLRLSMGTGLFLVVVSFCGVLLDLRMILWRRKGHYAAGMGGYLAMGIFGAAAAAFAAFIRAAAVGNFH